MSPARSIAVALALALGTTATLAGCTGSDERPSPPATTMSPTSPPGTDSPLAYPIFSDPAVPIYAAVGTRFGIALAAEPSAGYRWSLVSPPDPAVVLPLGSEFLTGPTIVALGESEAAAIISFVARADGETTIELRYVGADGQPDPEGRTATFTVVVNADGQPPPPETSDTTTEEP
jgi:hypothetical protein